MQFPTINLNGTAGEDLLDQQLTALNALRKALDKMQDACPNARDYLPQGSEEGLKAYRAAMAEHSARMLAIRNVMSEIETIAEHIA